MLPDKFTPHITFYHYNLYYGKRMKNFIYLVLITLLCGTIFLQSSEMFSDLNCTAANFHNKGKLVKIQLMLAPDYAKLSPVEQLIVQYGCKIKV